MKIGNNTKNTSWAKLLISTRFVPFGGIYMVPQENRLFWISCIKMDKQLLRNTIHVNKNGVLKANFPQARDISDVWHTLAASGNDAAFWESLDRAMC